MSVRSNRTSPPGGVRPGASRWSAASAPEGPPPTAMATPAVSPRARTAAANATVLARKLRNGSPFRRPVGVCGVEAVVTGLIRAIRATGSAEPKLHPPRISLDGQDSPGDAALVRPPLG